MRIHRHRAYGHTLIAKELNPASQAGPIILLHGVSHSLDVWDTQPFFMEHGRCFALTLPGHTPAVLPRRFRASELSAELVAKLLASAIKDLSGGEPCTVVGHSTGGWAGLALAAAYPQLVERLVIISGFVQGRWTGALAGWQRMARGSLKQRLRFRLLFAASRLISRKTFCAAPIWARSVADPQALAHNQHFDQFCAALYPYARKVDIGGLLAYCQRMPDIDISASLARIEAPSLIVAGAADPLVPVEQAQIIAERLPAAELVIWPDVGHLPMIEAPERYQQTIADWLRR